MALGPTQIFLAIENSLWIRIRRVYPRDQNTDARFESLLPQASRPFSRTVFFNRKYVPAASLVLVIIYFATQCRLCALTAAAKISAEPLRVTQSDIQAKPQRLSPDLQAATLTGAFFKGVTRTGDAVFDFKETNSFFKAQSIAAQTSGVQSLTTTGSDYKPIRDLIVFSSDERVAKAKEVAGMPVIGRHEAGGFVIVHSDQDFSPKQLRDLESDASIRYVEPNYPFYATQIAEPTEPNDPDYVAGMLLGLKAINASIAWNSVTSASPIVAIVDTGVDYKHPDLIANLWKSSSGSFGYNLLHEGSDSGDTYGHGTKCAGIIGGIGNNGIGGLGVVWHIQLMALKVADDQSFDADAIAKAIDYARAHGAKIISNSYGGPSDSAAIHDAIGRATEAGCLIIAAAGNAPRGQNGTNNDISPIYPASYKNSNIVSVLAVDQNDAIASWSNYGALSVGIGAPGVGIRTTSLNQNEVTEDGTSMATPFVAGACALIWSHPLYLKYTAPQIRQLLFDNGRRVSGLAGKCLTGAILDLRFLSAGVSPTARDSKGMSNTRPARTTADESDSRKIRVTGKLLFPNFAIGGETTGTLLVTSTGKKYQLNLHDNRELQERVASLADKKVVVEGTALTTKQVESGKQNIIQVQKLDPK